MHRYARVMGMEKRGWTPTTPGRLRIVYSHPDADADPLVPIAPSHLTTATFAFAFIRLRYGLLRITGCGCIYIRARSRWGNKLSIPSTTQPPRMNKQTLDITWLKFQVGFYPLFSRYLSKYNGQIYMYLHRYINPNEQNRKKL